MLIQLCNKFIFFFFVDMSDDEDFCSRTIGKLSMWQCGCSKYVELHCIPDR